MLPDLACETAIWPVPFDAGIAPLMARRGRAVVLLVSGDPFWFGAGASLARHLGPAEWVAHPAPSTFSLAAARLGWPIEDSDEYETIAGFVLELADKLPRHGDVFEKDGYKFSVQSMYGRRLRSIRVTAPEAVAVDADHEETDEE